MGMETTDAGRTAGDAEERATISAGYDSGVNVGQVTDDEHGVPLAATAEAADV